MICSARDPIHAVLTVSGKFDPKTALTDGGLEADYVWLQGEKKPWGRPNRRSGFALTVYSGNVFQFVEKLEGFFKLHEFSMAKMQHQDVSFWLAINARLDFHSGAVSVFCLSSSLVSSFARFQIELIVNASSNRLVQLSYGLPPDEDGPGSFEQLEAYVKEVAGVDNVSDYLTEIRSHGAFQDNRLLRAWEGLLESLGWKLNELSGLSNLLGSGLYTWSDRLQREIPLVFAPIAYFPGDDSDALVQEAKASLSAQYPEGVLLGFETLMFKEVGGFRYTFGGLIFFGNQWLPFALSQAANSFDALLTQRESGFSFQHPQPNHQDEGGQLATGFNLMLQGGDPELPWKVVHLHQGEWQVPMLV